MSDKAIYAPPRRVERAEDCYFYHAMEIPGHGAVGGDWDLRGGEDDYLGHVALEGQRVLEIGPASGFLTFHMEARGAEVVAVELAPENEWDIVPLAHLDLDEIRAERRVIMERLRNGFWFAHERVGSTARVHYGSAYELPAGLGRFDIAVMGAVLLHTRDPLRVVQQCAGVADSLVVDLLRHFALGCVLFTHSFALTGWRRTALDAAGRSASSLLSFCVKRAVRLLPALVACLLVTVFVWAPHLRLPVQQTIAETLAPSSGWLRLALAAPISVGLAAVSWRFVEAPALTFKQGLASPVGAASAQAVHPAGRAALEPTPPR
jgi:SAM-dependent methyltransferase